MRRALLLGLTLGLGLTPIQTARAAAPPILRDDRNSPTPAILEFTGTLFAVTAVGLGITGIVYGARAYDAGTEAANAADEAAMDDATARQESERTTGYIFAGAAAGSALIGAILIVAGETRVHQGRGRGLFRRARGLRLHAGQGGGGVSYTFQF